MYNNRVLGFLAALGGMLSASSAAALAQSMHSPHFIEPHNWEGFRYYRGKTGGAAGRRAAAKLRRHKAARRHLRSVHHR